MLHKLGILSEGKQKLHDTKSGFLTLLCSPQLQTVAYHDQVYQQTRLLQVHHNHLTHHPRTAATKKRHKSVKYGNILTTGLKQENTPLYCFGENKKEKKEDLTFKQ